MPGNGRSLHEPLGTRFTANGHGNDFRPSASQIAANPALAFHTYLTSPHQIFGNHIPAILTGFPLKTPVSLGGPTDP
jgi:hypothetical protein